VAPLGPARLFGTSEIQLYMDAFGPPLDVEVCGSQPGSRGQSPAIKSYHSPGGRRAVRWVLVVRQKGLRVMRVRMSRCLDREWHC
jgi:hypothetical protein